jgi:hypothetical protein
MRLGVDNQGEMRRVIPIQTCLTLLLAFCMAPFQHVHPAHSNLSPHHHHAESVIVHVHPLSPAEAPDHGDAAKFKRLHKPHAEWSLTTFVTMPNAARPLVFVPELQAILIISIAESSTSASVPQQRGHDPPPLTLSIPRAPPA